MTPDSFSDGGEYESVDRALERARTMLGEGASIIDVGAESTRPGSAPVAAQEQIRRALPVIEQLSLGTCPGPLPQVSIDTRLASVARAAVQAGASIVNDVSALRDDPGMAEVVASAGVRVVLMHMKGTPRDMQKDGGPHYDDVVSEVEAFLRERADFARSRGIAAEKIILDPGLGFGKRVEDNLLILHHLDRFVAMGYPILVGASRKSFIGIALDVRLPRARLGGSLACAAAAVLAGASIIRAHDVAQTVDVVRMCQAIREGLVPPVYLVM